MDDLIITNKEDLVNIADAIRSKTDETAPMSIDQMATAIRSIEVGSTGGTITTNAIDYDINVKSVNHRGYSAEAPENTIPAYILSKQKGFKYVECDVSFTSDGVAVLLHDSSISRTSDGSGDINSLTYTQVLQYDFGSWKDAKYTGTKIPTFEEFIMTCKGIGLHPYIELKSNGGYTQEQITSIVDMVESCGMRGKVTYISFNSTFLGYVKEADNKARLGYLADITTSTIATANGLKTVDNEVFMDVSYSNITKAKVELCIANDLPLEIWTVNSKNTIENMDNYITGVTSDSLIAGKILYDKYMTYLPSADIDVTLTNISVTYTGGNVAIGTSVNDLTGIVVTAHYSDGTTARITSYTLNGAIEEGDNTITVSYEEKSATFTVVGVAEDDIVTYTITRYLTGCHSSSDVTSISEGSYYEETITADSGYTMDGAVMIMTMGGSDISSNYVNGRLTINSVTGDIVISATATVIEIDNNAPVVNLRLTNITDGVARNIGTGGSTYDATIIKSGDGIYESDENGLVLMNRAAADVNYQFTKTEPFTICVRGSFEEVDSRLHQRLFRANNDSLSVYYSVDSGIPRIRAKLSGDGSNFTPVSYVATTYSIYGYVEASSAIADLDNEHTFVFTGDTNTGLIYYYVDGQLIVTQPLSGLNNTSKISVGSNDTNYYPEKIRISDFRIWNRTLSQEEVDVISGERIADGTLLYNWDFTSSLVDSIRGAEAVIGATDRITQDENGLTFGDINGTGGNVTLGGTPFSRNRTYEIDVDSFVFGGSTSYHIRFLVIPEYKDTGIIWRKTGNYSFYNGSWSDAFQSSQYDLTKPNVISGHTLKFQINEGGYITMFIDGVDCGTTTVAWKDGCTKLDIGNTDTQSAGNQLFDCVITGFRVYHGIV